MPKKGNLRKEGFFDAQSENTIIARKPCRSQAGAMREPCRQGLEGLATLCLQS